MLKAILSLGVALTALIATGGGAATDNEAVTNLCNYIRIDTSNPPGNEKAGAEFLAGIFKKNGIEATVYDTAPGRACVYAKLPGTGKKRPLILLNHIDVVPAKADDWQHGPFEGKVVDQEIWGRGTIDMKGMGMAELQAMLNIKRSGLSHDRDIVFLGTPDEEVGGTYGAGWFVKNHPELVRNAEFLLNEGYFIDTDASGKPAYWGVDFAEKSALWLKVTASGDAGHASMPMADSAPNRLARALTKIVNAPPEPHILPEVKTYFEKIADSQPEPQSSYYRNISESVKDPRAYEVLLKDKLRSSMLRNTVSLTVMKAGYKTNVIPAEATAELDCRLLPGQDKDAFVKEIEQKIADPAVKVSLLEFDQAQPSPVQSELFKAIETVAKRSGSLSAPVVPVVVPWFTDSHWFRPFGTIAYGFVPFRTDAAHLAGMHGKNERVGVNDYLQGVNALTDIVKEVSK